MKLYRKYLVEEQKEKYDEIVIKLRDPENQLIKLLKAAKIAGGIGHSAEIVMDPDLKEYRQKFWIDGDGPFYIDSLKLNGEEYKGDKK